MASIKVINLNNGRKLDFGYITNLWGLNGWNPIETQVPTGLRVKDYQAECWEKYDTHLFSAISTLNGNHYNTANAANAALDNVASYLLDNAVWIVGDLYTGGWFFASEPNTDTIILYSFYGLFEVTEVLTQTKFYEYIFSSTTVPFTCHANNNQSNPITDNKLYFFNYSDTARNAPINHVCNSRYEIRIVDSRCIGVYRGDDVETALDRWEQTQWYVDLDSNSLFEGAYLYNYTDDELDSGSPHPWKRWEQNRVVPNIQFFVGYDWEQDPNYNGELIGGYVPIDKNPNVDDSDSPSGGDSEGGSGGYGDQDGHSDEIDSGSTPPSTFLDCGVARIYIPTQQQMQNFTRFLFNDITQSLVDQLKKMWSNPLDYIGNVAVCHIAGLTATGTAAVSFGGINSGINSDYINTAFHDFSYICHVHEHWKDAFDYSNYTKIKIYIPYCGIYDLNVDEVMSEDTTIRVKYRVDIMSGMCVAFVKITKNQHDVHFEPLDSEVYQFNGNVFLPLSLTATDWRNTYQSLLAIAGGMIAPSPSSVAGMASSIMGQKVNVQHSGSIGTNFGYLGQQTPFLIIERPSKSEPNYNKNYNYATNYGYPLNKQRPLSGLKGFVKVAPDTMWSNNIHATNDELMELKDLLENKGIWIS